MILLVDILLPLAVFLSMGAVGLGLTMDDFRRMASLRLGITLGLVMPILLLPLLAVGAARGLALPPAVAGGLLVLSAAPPAAISSLYVALAGGDVALCVTLTAVSTVVSVFTMPLSLSLGFRGLSLPGASVEVPILATMGQLVFLLVLPAGLGMAVRAWRPAFAVKNENRFKALSMVAILAPLFLAVGALWKAFVEILGTVVLSALLFSLVAAALGYALGILAGPSPRGRFALAMNCSTRSFGVAAAVGAAFMGRTDFLAFVAAFFLTHAVLASAAIVAYRTFGPAQPAPRR